MKGSCLSDIKAVLKRTCIIIITDNFIYYRPATEAEVCVECIKLNDAKSLLRRSGGVKYMAYRKGNRDLSEDHHKHLQWEEAWMRSIMDNKGENKPPMPTETSITSPFSCKTTVSIQVHLEESGPHQPSNEKAPSFARLCVMASQEGKKGPRILARYQGGNSRNRNQTNELWPH